MRWWVGLDSLTLGGSLRGMDGRSLRSALPLHVCGVTRANSKSIWQSSRARRSCPLTFGQRYVEVKEVYAPGSVVHMGLQIGAPFTVTCVLITTKAFTGACNDTESQLEYSIKVLNHYHMKERLSLEESALRHSLSIFCPQLIHGL